MNKFLSRKLLMASIAEAVVCLLYSGGAIDGNWAGALSTFIATVFLIMQGQIDKEAAKESSNAKED